MTTALINPPTERLGSSHTSMEPRGILKAFPKRKKIHTNPSSKALAKIPKREDREEAGGEWTQPQDPHVLEPQASYIFHAQNQILQLTLPTQSLRLCLYLPCPKLDPQSLTGDFLFHLLPHARKYSLVPKEMTNRILSSRKLPTGEGRGSFSGPQSYAILQPK